MAHRPSLTLRPRTPTEVPGAPSRPAARLATWLLPLAVSSAACSNGGAAEGPSDEAGLAGDGSAEARAPRADGGSKTADATVPTPPEAGPPGGDSGPASEGGTDAVAHTDAAPPPFDVTFYVMADSHADPVPEDDLLSQVRAINQVGHGGTWPGQIGGVATGFLGGPIAPARGVVIAGDLTGWGTAPTEIPMFRSYFEKGSSSSSIDYPAYVGVGNHDIDTADRDDATATAYRATYWQYIDSRYEGPSAPVPVTSFDPASHSYSWDFDGVHLVMMHRFAGDTEYGRPSDMGFIAADLQKYASDGRPVFVFHHYGMDAFGTDGQWWNQADRDAYRALLTGYHVAGDFTGHTHYAFQYTWEALRVFQVNNAKAEIDSGNMDGNGSFAVVRITPEQLDIVTCRWTDDQGHYELIAPYFSGPADVGPVPSP
jgi:cytolysin (calcineurin-like family phosphatase)